MIRPAKQPLQVQCSGHNKGEGKCGPVEAQVVHNTLTTEFVTTKSSQKTRGV
jgi:hypothetical protein